MKHYCQLSLWAAVLFSCAALGAETFPDDDIADCYRPSDGGWTIHLSPDPNAPRVAPGSCIGAVDRAASYGEGHAFYRPGQGDNPRLHRRPLYPPADKSLVWSEAERAKFPQCGFRPLVLAYNEPRFLFDFHGAGGLLGHLYVGLILENGTSKWFHQWADLTVRYVDGRMEYALSDPDFPGVQVRLSAGALAGSIGLVVKAEVDGAGSGASLVWAYGGASAFFTNYAMTDPHFNFSPEQCVKDVIAQKHGIFTLTRAFDKTDSVMEQAFAAPHFQPEWKAIVKGGGFSKSETGLGDPQKFTAAPSELVASMDMKSGKKANCVAVQRAPLGRNSDRVFFVVGMGGNIDEAMREPETAYNAMLERNEVIGSRVVVRTPDPYLNAAATMMGYAIDGTWGDSTVMHGGWSWRFGYLGWRGWYGSNCYGWTDRIRKAIKNYTALGLIKSGDDAGALSSMLDTPGGVFYNMNEVFLDQVRQYFDYTNDLDLMREIFPVLRGIVEWENRRLQPKAEGLYENSLNTWISDSHWYVQGQCTQASAYMLGANRFLAELAERLGEDPAPYRDRAGKIRAAMQDKLWMKREGVFAEYLDTRGEKFLHAQPELPTIYHSIEFGAADPLQVQQMLDWASTHLKSVETPNEGRFYWSSNWYPNNGRSYTHSTHEMAYAEELNYALAQYAGGMPSAYHIILATLCGIFNGPTPGGLSCHSYVDGRQRANDEFSDASSMWARAVTEGLFGIVPKLPDGCVQLCPQFDECQDWESASIHTPLFSYRWSCKSGTHTIEWEAPGEISVHLKMPVAAAKILGVRMDGREVPFRVEPNFFQSGSWVLVETPKASHGRIEIQFDPAFTLPSLERKECARGTPVRIALSKEAPITEWKDPQGVLKEGKIEDGVLSGSIDSEPGTALLFGLVNGIPCPTWVVAPLTVLPAEPLPAPKLWSAPDAGDHDLARWTTVDLGGVFNSTLVDALEKVYKEATPPPEGASRVGFDYWRSHLSPLHHGERVQMPSDAAWRAKVDAAGIAWTRDGIPFKTAKEGPNIGIVTQTGGFPMELSFPVNAAGKTLYLMLSGMSFPVQSHTVHLRVTLHYRDSEDLTELRSPESIGDCWSTWCNRWHDTAANGFENIGGRSGPAGSADVPDLTQPITVDTEAHLVAIPMRAGMPLENVRIQAAANDIVFGVMGASVLK